MSRKSKTVLGYAILAFIGAFIGFWLGGSIKEHAIAIAVGRDYTSQVQTEIIGKNALRWAAIMACLVPGLAYALKAIFGQK